MRSYILLLICVTLWGSNFVFNSILLRELPAMHVAAFRLAITSLFLIVLTVFTRRFARMSRKDMIYFVPLVLVGTLLNQVTFYTGLKTTDATTSALILSLAPIFVALLARLFLGEPFTKRMALGSISALIGVFFVVGSGKGGIHLTPGIGLMFICMLSFACSVVLTRKLIERLDAFVITVYSTLAGCAFMFPFALWSEPNASINAPWWAWLLLLGSALLIQGMCSLIWNGQLRTIGAAKASIFLNLQPFVAMICGYVLLGTPVTLTQVSGSVLIIGGVVLATMQGLSAPKRVQPE